MKRLLAIILCTASSVAVADCYMRSSINLSGANPTPPTDVQRLVVPDTVGQKCVARYRVNIDGEWQTAEGTGVGPTEDEACRRALDVKRGYLLEEADSRRIRSDSQLVCSDLPDIRVRPVRIGEMVWESETDMHSHPQERKYFWYKRAKCRMFQERNPKDQNLTVYQGIVCQSNNLPNSKWRVIDKY